jgi:uncharacterized protein YbaA (DUF1428 family)
MYIDFMVIPVPTANLKAYKSMVKKSAAAWKRAGAWLILKPLRMM